MALIRKTDKTGELNQRIFSDWSERAFANLMLLGDACPRRAQLYGLIDSAVDDSLYPRLMQEPEESQVTCLFAGNPAISYRNVAPYLVVLNADSPLARDWFDWGWQKHWGIWLSSSQKIETIRTHLKKFLFVKTASAPKAYFRYYDPRVLSQIMPVLSEAQRGKLFGLHYKPMPDAYFAVAKASSAHPGIELLRYLPSPHLLTAKSTLQMHTWPWNEASAAEAKDAQQTMMTAKAR